MQEGNKNIKYLHIMHNDKFIAPYIDYIDKNFDSNEHLFLIIGGVSQDKITIPSRENIKNIEKFLKENKDFSLESISLNNSIVKTRENGVLEILPDEYSCDGFFIAKLKKMEVKC